MPTGLTGGDSHYDPLRFGDTDDTTHQSTYEPALASPSAPPHTPGSGYASALVDIPLTSPSATYHAHAPPPPLLPLSPQPLNSLTGAAHPSHDQAAPTASTAPPPVSLRSYPSVPTSATSLSPSAPPWPETGSNFPFSSSHSDSPHASRGPTYHITVGQPSKVMGPAPLPGLDGHYIVFPVSSTSIGPAGYPGPEGQVRRRFRDFVALSDLLILLYPGHVVPPRPRRNAIEGRRMHVRFLEDRRQALERYLHRLAQHPIVRRSEALRVFLQEDSDLRSSPAWRRLLPMAPPGKGVLQQTGSLLRQMVGQGAPTTAHDVVASVSAPRSTLQALSDKVAALRGNAAVKGVPLSPLEQQLRDEGLKVAEVHRLLAQLATRAAALRARSEEHSAALSDLSRITYKLGAYEESMGFASGHAEAALSNGCLRVAKLRSLAAEHSARQLAQINDYVTYMPGVQAALHHRDSALALQLSLETDLARRTGRLNVAMATPGQFQKQAQLESEVACLRGAVEAARSEYCKASEQNAADLAALRKGMARDMATMLQEFAVIQVASAQKAEELWRETLQAMA